MSKQIVFKQIYRFGIVGTLAASAHFAVVIYFVQIYGLAPLVANLFGFIAGFQISYWGHKSWTFASHDVFHRHAIPKLLVVQIAGLALNEVFFYSLLSLPLPYPIALLIVLVCFPLFTFAMSKLWVFKP